jgi:2-oxoglutarate ferredoxin oxidoreductase subunit beta
MSTTTTPYGNLDQPVLASELMVSAGANYVARWTTFHVRQLAKAMEELMDGEGFRFLEIISQCPTHFDKDEKRPAAEVLEQYRAMSVPAAQAKEPYDGQAGSKMPVGVLADRKRPGYVRRLEAVEKRLREGDS